MAAHEKERAASAEPWEEFRISLLGSSSFMEEAQRSYKGRHCRKFYTEEGCPYGDNCTYIHDEQLKSRESSVIIVTHGERGPVAAPTAGPPAASNSTLKYSNRKTRICKRWEQTAYCPYGNNCTFAHGAAELHGYGGGLVAPEANPNRQGLGPSTIVAATGSSVACANGSYPVQRSFQKWKGLDKLSKIKGIYGDWIDDFE